MVNYETALPFLRNKPTWLSNVDEQDRMAAYDFYDDLIDNSPEGQRLLLRGDQDDMPIYVPTAKQVVKTLSRYVARDLGFSVGSSALAGAPGSGVPAVSQQDQDAAIVTFGELFKREQFFGRFKANKRWGLTRGDICIYLIADPVKPAGTRLSIKHIDPRMYFPIMDKDDPDRILGCDLITQVTDPTDPKKEAIRRERYLKPSHPDHPNASDDGTSPIGVPIAHEVVVLAADGWDDPTKAKLVATVLPLTLMPAQITALPVYHIKVDEEPGNPYGRSVLQGMERIFLGINQAVSDEDIALAMAGLGFFSTDQQLDEEDGDDWTIGPKRVVETSPGGKFERVNGVPTVAPSQQHIQYLKSEVFQSVGINDVALGSVDSTVAESGIALELRLGPIVDESSEIDETIDGVLTSMFHDLLGWFQAFEGVTLAPGIQVTPSFGSKVPENKQQKLANLLAMYNARVISAQFYRDQVSQITGMQFPDDIEAQIAHDVEQAAAATDPYAARAANEMVQ